MTFSQVYSSLNWDKVRLEIYATKTTDVERALSKNQLDLIDFKALISPAAEPYLELMAQCSAALTRQRFGHTIGFYLPLYLSNLCANVCSYCGFSMNNKIRRKTLSLEEIHQECDAIKDMGFDAILLVTGEHENKVGMAYFRQVLPIIKAKFSHVAMEVQPLDTCQYAELKSLGLDAVMVYQETYHPVTYAKHHLRGNKTDFDYRLATPDRLAQAGIDKIGLGALIGLDDWRTDCFFAAAHLDYLEQNYWQSRYSISFPRLRPCEGGLAVKSVMTDRQLVQLICAYRLFNPQVELSLSTREPPYLRDNLLPLGITNMSAASSTQPGGYAKPHSKHESELEQFSISDNRSATQVAKVVSKAGLQVVWKDWERVYSGG